MIVSGGLLMPITGCMRPLSITVIRVGRRPRRVTNYTKSANIAGRRTIAGGTKISTAGTISAIGMIGITTKTIGRMIGTMTGDRS